MPLYSEGDCRVCAKIFCCRLHREKHENEHHIEQLHLVQHLPLLCKICNQLIWSLAGLRSRCFHLAANKSNNLLRDCNVSGLNNVASENAKINCIVRSAHKFAFGDEDDRTLPLTMAASRRKSVDQFSRMVETNKKEMHNRKIATTPNTSLSPETFKLPAFGGRPSIISSTPILSAYHKTVTFSTYCNVYGASLSKSSLLSGSSTDDEFAKERRSIAYRAIAAPTSPRTGTQSGKLGCVKSEERARKNPPLSVTNGSLDNSRRSSSSSSLSSFYINRLETMSENDEDNYLQLDSVFEENNADSTVEWNFLLREMAQNVERFLREPPNVYFGANGCHVSSPDSSLK